MKQPLEPISCVSNSSIKQRTDTALCPNHPCPGFPNQATVARACGSFPALFLDPAPEPSGLARAGIRPCKYGSNITSQCSAFCFRQYSSKSFGPDTTLCCLLTWFAAFYCRCTAGVLRSIRADSDATTMHGIRVETPSIFRRRICSCWPGPQPSDSGVVGCEAVYSMCCNRSRGLNLKMDQQQQAVGTPWGEHSCPAHWT